MDYDRSILGNKKDRQENNL